VVPRAGGKQLAPIQGYGPRVDDAEGVVPQLGGASGKIGVTSRTPRPGQGQVRVELPVLGLEAERNQGVPQLRHQRQERLAITVDPGPERAGMRRTTEHAGAVHAQGQGSVPTRRFAHDVGHRLQAIVRHVTQEYEGQVRGGVSRPRGAGRVGTHTGDRETGGGRNVRTGVDGHEQPLCHRFIGGA